MTRVEFVVPGKIDTNHRPRASIRGGKVRTYKAAGYRQYVQRLKGCAGFWFGHARWSSLDYRVRVTVTLHEHDKRSRDLDNVCKPILDALTGIAWADDRQVDELRVVRGEVRKTAPCVVVCVEVIA
jgi:Holliday junction resolvase RusA-like endonuclease